MRGTKNEMWDGRSTLNRRGNSQAERICREGKLLSVERRSVNGQKEQEGTRGNRKGSDELLMRGLVQLVRTPVTQEAAGSIPVAPARESTVHPKCKKRDRDD